MQFLKSLLILAAITSMANAADPDDNRWNNFQAAEYQRIAAQGQRIAAEGQRIAAEGQRIAAQGQRIASECQRIGNWYHYPPFSMPSFGSSYAAPNNTSQEMTNQALQLRQMQERQEAEQREQREAQERAEFAEVFRQQQLLQQEEKAREERELQEALRQVEAFMEQERQQREAAEQKLKEEKPKLIIKDQDLILAGELYKALSKEHQMDTEIRVLCLGIYGMNEEYATAVDNKLFNGDDSEED